MHKKVFTTVLVFMLGLATAAPAFEDDFSSSPLDTGSGWTLDGLNESALADGTPVPAFEWTAGTLTVNYNSQWPSVRLLTPLGTTVTGDDSFRMTATCTVRSDNFAVQYNQMSAMITFALVNSVTTGLDRSGSISSAADVFDNLEMTYFPNPSDYGGPFLSPTAFGSDDGSHNLWANFAPYSSEEVTLTKNVPLEFVIVHNGNVKTILWSVREVGGDYIFQDGMVDLSGLSTSFEVDSFAISMYEDGWSDHPDPPSVAATVDFTNVSFSLFESPAIQGTPATTAVGSVLAVVALAAAAARKLARRNRLGV